MENSMRVPHATHGDKLFGLIFDSEDNNYNPQGIYLRIII